MPVSLQVFEGMKADWTKDEYLKPTSQNDQFLCYDWDSFTQQEATHKVGIEVS